MNADASLSAAASPSPIRESIRVALLGLGTVGRGVFRMLEENSASIRAKAGLPVELVRIGVRDLGRVRGIEFPHLTDDARSIVQDPNIDVVIELIGGIDPALDLVERALEAGKSVVTANKELIAKHGGRLLRMAFERGIDLHFEAAVGGGIPLVQPLKHQLAGNDVVRLMGILNGTTNYILTQIAERGVSFEEALSHAQAFGFAEADPTNDVEAYDAAYKIAILGSIAFGGPIPVEQVYREGIQGVQPDDVHFADVLGYAIKLVAICEPGAGGRSVSARVHPLLVPKEHPLAGVRNEYNALWFQGDFVGDVMFSGRGAGAEATASAVVGDLIDVARNLKIKGPGSVIPWGDPIEVEPIGLARSSYYLRLLVDDRPKVLGEIALALGEHGVSLSAMEMRVFDSANRVGEIVFLTHEVEERLFQRALADLEQLMVVKKVCNWLRVVEK